MYEVRKIFGWLFACFFICCLGACVSFLRHHLGPGHSALGLGTFFAFGALLLIACILGTAWWSTWKELPNARAWGIAASLVNLAVPSYMIFHIRQRLDNALWMMMASGAVALIAYAWPEREEYLGVETPPDGPDPPIVR
jgi:hypothetical protein